MKKISSGIWWTAAIVVLIVLLIVWSKYALSSKHSNATNQSGSLPGLQVNDKPWPAEIGHLRERLSLLHLPALLQEGTALHIHEHLDIFIHGVSNPVAQDIGVNEMARFISPLHTHDDSGIIHVESPVVATFTLGQFFDIWGLQFSKICIGSYCTNATSTLKIFVNGTLYQGDPHALILAPHQEIVVTYGTESEIPKIIPATYVFPANY